MRHEYDTLIRQLAEATQLDFYYVERQLKALIKDVIREEGIVHNQYDDTHQRPRTTEESTRP